MSIWAIADIHASQADPVTGKPTKPMEIFGAQWVNHLKRLESAWQDVVADTDWVIVAGDTDWGLRLEDALETLALIDSWKGHKILIRGNHDYWWSSKNTSRVRQAMPPSIHALHNNSLRADGFNICGAKGSPVPGALDWTDQDEKLLNRELGRLALSLEGRDPALPTIVALHFPPFYVSTVESRYRELIDQADVACVVYGHLHGDAAAFGPRNRFGSAHYRLVAGDAVDFRPVPIAQNGRLVDDPGQER